MMGKDKEIFQVYSAVVSLSWILLPEEASSIFKFTGGRDFRIFLGNLIFTFWSQVVLESLHGKFLQLEMFFGNFTAS